MKLVFFQYALYAMCFIVTNRPTTNSFLVYQLKHLILSFQAVKTICQVNIQKMTSCFVYKFM